MGALSSLAEVELLHFSPLISQLIDDSVKVLALFDRQEHVLARLELLLQFLNALFGLSGLILGLVEVPLRVLYFCLSAE